MPINFGHMDSHAIKASTLNQLLGTLLAIVLELASRCHIQLQHPTSSFAAPSSAASVHSFEFVDPAPTSPATSSTQAPLLTPPSCEYHCRFCSAPCSRIPNAHKHHSCWEHRHRR